MPRTNQGRGRSISLHPREESRVYPLKNGQIILDALRIDYDRAGRFTDSLGSLIFDQVVPLSITRVLSYLCFLFFHARLFFQSSFLS